MQLIRQSQNRLRPVYGATLALKHRGSEVEELDEEAAERDDNYYRKE
jgi:hypothetical protein